MTKQDNQLTTTIQPLKGLRQKGESDNAVIACNDWLRMGTGRTLPELLKKYTSTTQNIPPTQYMPTLKDWSRKFTWSERAVEYDADYEAIKNEQRQAAMDYGAALDFERVNKLKRLALFLEAQIYETSKPDESGQSTYHNVWMPDVKQIGSGEFAERVDIERFNGSLISEYRSTLDDIAKEVGGRIKKQEVSGPDGGAIEWSQVMKVNPDDSDDPFA